MNIGLEHYLVVGGILFALGTIGFLTRRNLILMMLSAELMLHGVSTNLTAFSRYHNHHQGQIFTIMVLTIAACEAGLALSIVLALYQRKRSLDVRLWTALGEEELMAPQPDVPLAPISDSGPKDPTLTVAGRLPKVHVDPASLASAPKQAAGSASKSSI